MKEGSPPLMGVYSRGCCTFLDMDPMWIKCYLLLRMEHCAGSPDPKAGGSDAAEGLQRCCDTTKRVTTKSMAHNFIVSFRSN